VILGSHAVEVLWPGGLELSEPGNDSSVVVAARPLAECVRCLSGLFLGDIGEIPQRILVGRQSLPSVDVVKVSHHGSADQFSGLYAHVNARVGLMGVGADNTYGHPTEVALDILNAQGSTPLRSDERGTLTLSRNAEGDIVFWAEREAGPG
jgi:competence protein ComEC